MNDEHLKQRMSQTRTAKIKPKVAAWIGAGVAMMALLMFPLMIVTYGYQKGWW